MPFAAAAARSFSENDEGVRETSPDTQSAGREEIFLDGESFPSFLGLTDFLLIRPQQDWEDGILNALPSKLRLKYRILVDNQMAEVRARYTEVMRKTSLLSKISGGSERPRAQVPPSKLPGKTKNYKKFLRNRERLSRKYFASHKFMRLIVEKSISHLPELICDFGRYRRLGYLELSE